VRIAYALLIAITFAAPALADAISKKDREFALKSSVHGPPPAFGTRPMLLLNLYNEWTKEWLAVDPTSATTPAAIDGFLRDHFTNKHTAMEPKLLGILLAAAKNFRSSTIHVVSGFRHPKYNLMLRKKGHQVARDSQHTHGNAVDFFVPHVTTLQLHAWAKTQRIGGVGLYLESGFVHMDIGPVRYWSGD
jgi:uncharacterized protein YcbK (DUF882 family)